MKKLLVVLFIVLLILLLWNRIYKRKCKDWFFSEHLQYQDINKDGKKELVVRYNDMGNAWLGRKFGIYQEVYGGFQNIIPELEWENHLGISKVSDLNQDGVQELIIIDDIWEITHCACHADSPIRYLIYSWKDDKYQDASKEFGSFYQDYIDKDLSEKCSGEKEFCFGNALTKYFAYKQSGREEEGWKIFLALTEGVEDLVWPSKTCRDYVIRLHDEGKEIIPPNLDYLEE